MNSCVPLMCAAVTPICRAAYLFLALSSTFLHLCRVVALFCRRMRFSRVAIVGATILSIACLATYAYLEFAETGTVDAARELYKGKTTTKSSSSSSSSTRKSTSTSISIGIGSSSRYRTRSSCKTHACQVGIGVGTGVFALLVLLGLLIWWCAKNVDSFRLVPPLFAKHAARWTFVFTRHVPACVCAELQQAILAVVVPVFGSFPALHAAPKGVHHLPRGPSCCRCSSGHA